MKGGPDCRTQGLSSMASLRQVSLPSTSIVTLALLFLVAAASAESKKEYRFTVGPNSNISVDTQYGAIAVHPGSGNLVVVTATLKSDKVEVDQQQNGNRVTIASHLLDGSTPETGRVDYELTIPPDASINLHSASGPLSAEKLQGDLTFEGTDAMVNVRNIQNGHVHVRTLRGPITITDVRNGHLDLASISGDVSMKAVTGPLVQVSSGSGKISYDGDFGSDGDYKFTTHSGDIEALVPPDVSADFRAHSVIGRVQHDIPLKSQHSRFREEVGRSFVGTMGKAASDVVLRSFSGKIRLKQR